MLIPTRFLHALVALLALQFYASISYAIPITVGTDTYDVTTYTTTDFTTDTVLMNQVWWENETLALAFASALGDQLGFPNFSGRESPYFAYDLVYFGSVSDYGVFSADYVISGNQATHLSLGASNYNTDTYAIATLISSVPEPPIVLLLASGLIAFGVARRKNSA